MAALCHGMRVMSRFIVSVSMVAYFLCGASVRACARGRTEFDRGSVRNAVQFDLSGTGTAPGLTIRGTRKFTSHLAIEGSLPVSWPSQDFGESTLFAPEAHLQYHWRTGALRPFAGGGAGVAWTDAGIFGNSELNLTLSAAVGTKVDLSDRLALFGELRLRGIKHNFAGSTAEWLGGISWRVGGPQSVEQVSCAVQR